MDTGEVLGDGDIECCGEAFRSCWWLDYHVSLLPA